MKTGLILMTALPPTKGHAKLIEFALKYMETFDDDILLNVMVNGRTQEPFSVWKRVEDLQDYESFNKWRLNFIGVERDLPQEPSDHPNFWNIWTNLIKQETNIKFFNFVFASESYGGILASILGANWVPFNIGRDMIPIKATDIRNDPLGNFDLILPTFQNRLRKTVTIFGPESIGKTTLGKALSEKINGHFLPEWTRDYLEGIGPEITNEKMETITRGQYALQESAKNLLDKPFIIRDTDLLSTLGYYELWKDMDSTLCADLARKSFADLYILPNDEIPFTPDPLRYGGDKRESDNKYWIKLLDRYGLNYYVLQSYSKDAQLEEARKLCINFFNRKNDLRFIR